MSRFATLAWAQRLVPEPKRVLAHAAAWGALVLFLVRAFGPTAWDAFEAVLILGAALGLNHRAGAVGYVVALRRGAEEPDAELDAWLRAHGVVLAADAAVYPAADDSIPAHPLERSVGTR